MALRLSLQARDPLLKKSLFHEGGYLEKAASTFVSLESAGLTRTASQAFSVGEFGEGAGKLPRPALPVLEGDGAWRADAARRHDVARLPDMVDAECVSELVQCDLIQLPAVEMLPQDYLGSDRQAVPMDVAALVRLEERAVQTDAAAAGVTGCPRHAKSRRNVINCEADYLTFPHRF